MIIIYGGILLAYGVLLIYAKKRRISCKAPFTAMAKEVEQLIGNQGNRGIRREQLKQLHCIMHNQTKVRELEQAYRVQVIEMVLKVVFAGTLLASILYLQGMSQGKIPETNEILRNAYLGGSEQLELLAEVEEEYYEVPITISEQRYTQGEIEQLFVEYEFVLEEAMVSEGESPQYITNNLNFPSTIAGYPFTNQWRSSNYHVIQSDGTVTEEIGVEGALVTIYVTSSYYEYTHEYEYALMVYPKELTPEESLVQLLEQSVEEADSSGVEEPAFILPSTIEDVSVQWKAKQENTSFYVFILILVASIALVQQKQKSLAEAIKKRDEQMVLDYAPMVNQLVLYLGAGMTMRSALSKIAGDYRKEKKGEVRYVYEELKNLCQELESGASESEAYENFGRRCNNRTYLKFATLLSQNVRKGANELLVTLRKEAAVALEERKAYVKIRAEKATTKLLIPMVMMLGVVMVVIIVPAFMSFQI